MNDGPLSATLIKHKPYTSWTPRVYWWAELPDEYGLNIGPASVKSAPICADVFREPQVRGGGGPGKHGIPTNTTLQPSVGSMSVQRLRRCPNIDQTLGQCLEFASTDVEPDSRISVGRAAQCPVQTKWLRLLYKFAMTSTCGGDTLPVYPSTRDSIRPEHARQHIHVEQSGQMRAIFCCVRKQDCLNFLSTSTI